MFVNRLSAVTVITVLMLLALLVLPQAAHAEQVDGEYTIGFNIMHADKKNASIAEGYWDQPAKLIIKDGSFRVQTTINKHAWVTEFATRYNGTMSEVKTLSVDEAADERLTEFPIANLTDLVESNVSVTLDFMDYDHSYTMYFKFKPETLTLVKAAGESAPAATGSTTKEPAATKSPDAESAATQTPAPTTKATTAPTSAPAVSAAAPAATTAGPNGSEEPSPSAAATDQAAPTLVPTVETDGQELIESSTTPAQTAAPAEVEVENGGEAGAESHAGNALEGESVESVEAGAAERNGNGLIITLVLFVLLAAAAAIIFRTRQNKK